MHGSRAQAIVRQIGVLGSIAIVVTMLTVLFNIVGALAVSVVAGMISGTRRRFDWHAISLSLVAPVVGLVLGHLTNLELDSRGYLSASGICLGAFWATWLATYLVTFLESRSRPVAGTPDTTSPMKRSGTEEPSALQQLQGTWRFENERPGAAAESKVLVVERDQFRIAIVNSEDAPRVVGKGELKVHHSNGQTTLVISARKDS